jgi:hypothetical protein
MSFSVRDVGCQSEHGIELVDPTAMVCFDDPVSRRMGLKR